MATPILYPIRIGTQETMFTKATRTRAHIKMAITGPSGSGKTLSALKIARGLAGDGKIALIDTENESASLYADATDFDTCPISAPFTTEKYITIINEAVKAGYSVLVIDSLTHAWAGEGGLLSQKESLDARGGNSFTNWASITKKQEMLKSALLQAPIHVIATMRSKQEYVIEQNGGKSAPKKVGTAPIQRDGMEYEFTIVLDMAANHEFSASKDRTGLFDGKFEIPKESHGAAIRAWLESGAEPTQGTVVNTSKTSNPYSDRFDALVAYAGITYTEKVTDRMWFNAAMGWTADDSRELQEADWIQAVERLPAFITAQKAKREAKKASQTPQPKSDEIQSTPSEGEA